MADTKASLEQDLEKALRNAAFKNDLEKVKQLIALKVDVNAQDTGKYGYSALHWAAEKGHLSIVLVLLQAKADPHVVDGIRKTESPLSLAKKNQHSSVVEVLEKCLFTSLEDCAREALEHSATLEKKLQNETVTPNTKKVDRKYKYLNTVIEYAEADIKSKIRFKTKSPKDAIAAIERDIHHSVDNLFFVLKRCIATSTEILKFEISGQWAEILKKIVNRQNVDPCYFIFNVLVSYILHFQYEFSLKCRSLKEKSTEKTENNQQTLDISSDVSDMQKGILRVSEELLIKITLNLGELIPESPKYLKFLRDYFPGKLIEHILYRLEDNPTHLSLYQNPIVLKQMKLFIENAAREFIDSYIQKVNQKGVVLSTRPADPGLTAADMLEKDKKAIFPVIHNVLEQILMFSFNQPKLINTLLTDIYMNVKRYLSQLDSAGNDFNNKSLTQYMTQLSQTALKSGVALQSGNTGNTIHNVSSPKSSEGSLQQSDHASVVAEDKKATRALEAKAREERKLETDKVTEALLWEQQRQIQIAKEKEEREKKSKVLLEKIATLNKTQKNILFVILMSTEIHETLPDERIFDIVKALELPGARNSAQGVVTHQASAHHSHGKKEGVNGKFITSVREQILNIVPLKEIAPVLASALSASKLKRINLRA